MISLTELDDDSLSRVQAERAQLVTSLNDCLDRAQVLDDKVSALDVIVHTDDQSGPAVELYDHSKKVSVGLFLLKG